MYSLNIVGVNRMKIFNPERTHFMQKNLSGTGNVNIICVNRGAYLRQRGATTEPLKETE